MKIAILGAECTGKSALAQSLTVQLSDGETHAIWVPEVLREWCDREGRTPLVHEQSTIALEQMRQVKSAPPCHFLLVDSHPVMTAIYSDLYFADLSLYPSALLDLRQYQLTIVMGMDLEWVADGIQRDGPAMRQRVNHRLRETLQQASLPYTIVYGTGIERTNAALRAIEKSLEQPQSVLSTGSKPWAWHCDKCSDAGCEHRIFTDRLQIDKD